MIVALCPLDNAFDTAASLVAIERQLAHAAEAGAALAVFPECGLTGFKARSDLTHEHVRGALTAVQASAARHRVATLMPSIELDRSDRPRNRARLFDAEGVQRACFEKTGLTRPEQTWFATGEIERPRTFTLGGMRFGVLFCIELDDPAARYVHEPVDAMLWPAIWGHGEPFDWSAAGPLDAYERMRSRARAWNAPVLQANFRRPDTPPPAYNGSVLGGSVAVAADGTLLRPFEPFRSQPLCIDLPGSRQAAQ